MQLKSQQAAGKPNRKQRRAAKKNQLRNFQLVGGRAAGPDIDGELTRAGRLQEAGDLAAAKEIYDRLLKEHPKESRTYLFIARFHQLQNNLEGSFLALTQAVNLEPANAKYWHLLSLELVKKGELNAALAARQKSINLNPENAEYYVDLGNLLNGLYKIDGALAAFELAVKLAPDSANAQLAYGLKIQSLGRFEEAKDHLWRSIKLNPNDLTPYAVLLRDRKLDKTERTTIFEALRNSLKSKSINYESRAKGLYAAARIKEGDQDYQEAIEFYHRSNQEISAQFPFNQDAFKQYIDCLIASFQPDVFNQLDAARTQTSIPVFIVGMPRSGTTLAEQIIGSHSEVFAAGEMLGIKKIVSDLTHASRGNDIKYPNNVGDMNSEVLKSMGESHLSNLRDTYSNEALRIIDKLPENFLYLGLIAILFPNARIIHMKRDPMATCWSCYAQYFQNFAALSYTFDLSALGFYYTQYRRLMEHWQNVLPIKVLDVQYETLLDNQERVSRQMIDHIGLDWEDTCLNFHQRDEAVLTASVWQVRQPIYKASVEKWRRYETYLEPLRMALGTSD